MRNLPALFVLLFAMLLAASPPQPAYAAQDEVLALIAQQRDSTAVGFTGGFGNIIGFRRFTASHFAIFYAADAAGLSDAHARTHIADGGKSWSFTYDQHQRLIEMTDGAASRLTIKYNSDGSLTYQMAVLDGFAANSTNGLVGASVLRREAGVAEQQALPPQRSGDPKLTVQAQVKACESWPGRPLDLTLTYDYGQGLRTLSVKLDQQTGTAFSYKHVVEPLEGIRSDADAKALVGDGFAAASRCGVASRTLKSICKTLGPGLFATACDASQQAYDFNCAFTPRIERAIGNATAASIKGNLPDALAVTAQAFYRDPNGNTLSVTTSRQVVWNQPSQQIPLEFPCWSIFQGDFSAKARFSANDGQCHPLIELGKRASLILPLNGSAGSPSVRFDYFKVLHEKPGCFIGTFTSDYVLWLPGTLTPGRFKASLTQAPPFEEIYDFDLETAGNRASGTYRFRMNHTNDHTADVTIPIELDRVIAK